MIEFLVGLENMAIILPGCNLIIPAKKLATITYTIQNTKQNVAQIRKQMINYLLYYFRLLFKEEKKIDSVQNQSNMHT